MGRGGNLESSGSLIRARVFHPERRSEPVAWRLIPHDGPATAIRVAGGDGRHCKGRITLYEPRGEYQLVVEAVEPKGIGALQLAYEQLKARLAAEGLFDEARKRPLPAFPTTVGVVTSLAGAAIRDIVAVLRRRNPLTNVLIAPVPVQETARPN